MNRSKIIITTLIFAFCSGVYAQDSGSSTESAETDTEVKRGHEHKRKLNKEKRKLHMERRGQKMVERMMTGADVNEDGKIDLNEFLGNAETRFNQMDEDKDGYVTGDEMRGWSKNMRKKHHLAMKEAREQHRNARKEADKAEDANGEN